MIAFYCFGVIQLLICIGYTIIARFSYKDGATGEWITRNRNWLQGVLLACNAVLLIIMYAIIFS